MRAPGLAVLSTLVLGSCAGAAAPEGRHGPPVAPIAVAPPPRPEGGEAGPGPAAESEEVFGPPHLTLGRSSLRLPAGRTLATIEVVPGELATLAVTGPRDALLDFSLVSPDAIEPFASKRPLLEDGLLPRAVGFVVPEGVSLVDVVVDLAEPATLVRASVPAQPAPKLDVPLLDRRLAGKAPPGPPFVPVVDLPLVAMPIPATRDEGYVLESAGRYVFVRTDVLAALREAFRVVRKRYRRDPIALGDASQWDGRRPASDLGAPRHISHEGGRDIDIGLPASDGEPSTVRAHCAGVLTEKDRQACAPGTIKGLDAERLALLLGVLVDLGAPPVEKVFLDDVYIREVQRALRTLRERKWISKGALETLGEDGLLRASPWHADHVHVRFAGLPGRPVVL